MYVISTERGSGKTLIDLDQCIGMTYFKNDNSATLYMSSGEKFHLENVDFEQLADDWQNKEDYYEI